MWYSPPRYLHIKGRWPRTGRLMLFYAHVFVKTRIITYATLHSLHIITPDVGSNYSFYNYVTLVYMYTLHTIYIFLDLYTRTLLGLLFHCQLYKTQIICLKLSPPPVHTGWLGEYLHSYVYDSIYSIQANSIFIFMYVVLYFTLPNTHIFYVYYISYTRTRGKYNFLPHGTDIHRYKTCFK